MTSIQTYVKRPLCTPSVQLPRTPPADILDRDLLTSLRKPRPRISKLKHVFKWKHLTKRDLLPEATHLLCFFGEGLQNVSLPGVVAIGVLQTLQDALPEDQHGDAELVPEQLHGVDVYDDVDRVGQQL